MRRPPRSSVFRWPSAPEALVAVGILATGVALRWAAGPLLGTRYPFVTIFVVVAVLSSWYGAVMGVPAVVLGLIISLILFIDPPDAIFPLSPADWAGVTLFLFTSTLIVAVGEAKVRAQRRTAEAAERASRSAAELAVANERLRGISAELSAANAELSEFAHIVAHDMAEPLRAIASVSTILSEDHAEDLSPATREHARRIAGLSHRAGELLKSILEYSTAERTDLVRSECDLTQVAADAAESVATRIGGEPVCLSRLPRAACDGALARELFANLITNAYKYNSSSPRRVEIGVREGPSGRALYVRDNGIGVPPEQAARIFQMFRRLHRREEFGGGMGAGLAICRKIVDRHGGRIWIESRPGAGSTFYFTLWPADGADPPSELPVLAAVVVPKRRAARAVGDAAL